MQNAETVLNVIDDTGEPDAVKAARPVRKEADGKVLRATRSNSPAAYLT